MKKGIKYFVWIGAVVVSLLMIANATAINVVQTETVTTQKKDVYVEPNICLTQKYLPILKRSEKQLIDPEYKKMVQQIILLLEEKGKVTSEDIQNIVKDSPASTKAVYALGIIHGMGPGNIICFPFLFLKGIFRLIMSPVPTALMGWKVQYNQDPWGQAPSDMPTTVTVKPWLLNDVYNKENHAGGLAIGYIGICGLSGPCQGWNGFYYDFWIDGAFILLFIN